MVQLKSRMLRELGAISRIVQFNADMVNKEFSLQKGQFMFLTRVCENPGINLMQLSDLLHVDKTTTSKAVQKLFALAYLRRSTDSADKRAVKLYPSDSALLVYDKLIKKENSVLELLFADLSQEEKTLLEVLLKKVKNNAEELWLSIK